MIDETRIKSDIVSIRFMRLMRFETGAINRAVSPTLQIDTCINCCNVSFDLNEMSCPLLPSRFDLDNLLKYYLFISNIPLPYYRI